MNKKFRLKKENPTILKTSSKPTQHELESFFRGEEVTDLQKYTYTFITKKREK